MIDEDRRIRAKVASRERASGSSHYESFFTSAAQREFTEIEVETAATRAAGRRRQGRFLKGPVPMRDIATAARLPGKALAVFLAVRHRVDLTRSNMTKLTAGLMHDLGVSKDAKARALRQLETAGLITVRRAPGQSPNVTLVRKEQ